MEMEATELFSGFLMPKKKWQVQYIVFPERLEKLVPKSLPPPSCFVPPHPLQAKTSENTGVSPKFIRINHPPGRPRYRYLCPVRSHQDM